jgi:microcystin-dependent protein
MGSYFRDFHAPKATQQPTIGDTKFSVVRQDHMGWLNCDGRLVSTETYPLLFRVIQYSFGGSNDLFRLPDMRSAVPGAIGPGSNYNVGLTMSNVSPRTLGQAVGEETHTLIRNEMPSHTHGSVDVSGNANGDGNTTTNGLHNHTATDSGHTHSYVNQANDQTVAALPGETAADQEDIGQTTGIGYANITVGSNGNHNHQIFNTGGDAPHNNMQPTVFIGNMFIYSGKIHGPTSKWRYEIDTNIL